MFSVLTTMPELAGLIREYFVEITERGLFPVVYADQLDDLIIDITQEILYYFANVIYKNLEKKIPLKEVIANLKDYYMKSTNPERYKFSADLENLEISLTTSIKTHLDSMDKLTKESKEDIYKELIEAILKIIETGFNIPTYFYDTEFRLANKLDQTDYNVRYVVDFHIYDEQFNRLKYVFESYGFVIDVKSMDRVLKYTFNNQLLYKRFLALN
jgi:hypothetical protein